VRIDDIGGVEQAAAHLSGSERGQAGPLEAVVGQPQAGIGAVDAAVAFAVVGDPMTVRSEQILGLALQGRPQQFGSQGLAGSRGPPER
jgi:hypothetical protein